MTRQRKNLIHPTTIGDLAVLIFAVFFGVSFARADYDAATDDLTEDWTVTSENGITLDGSVLDYAKHTGELTISSDPTITLTNGAVFEQSGKITTNKYAVTVQGGGTLKITSSSDFNGQAKGFYGFYIHDGSVVDTTGAANMCLCGTTDNLQFYDNSELIIGNNMWTKTTTQVHVYDGANAKISQSTASGIPAAAGLNLSTAGSVTFNVEENASLTSTARIYDEGSTGGITKTGAGTLTILNANNSFVGATTLSAGSLVLSGAGNLTATSGVSVASGATLEFTNSDSDGEGGAVTFDRPISGEGALVKSGTGTAKLTGATTYTGTTTVSGGELVFANSTLPVSAMTATGGTLVLGTAGNTITVKRGASITASGGAVRVDGNLVFESAGSGFVACDGSWTGDGSIKLDGGYIRVGTNFNTTTGIDFNGGSILNNNNDAVLASDLTITKDGSTMQAGWKLSLTHTGALKGSASLTVGSDSGWLIFAGNGSNYQGSLLVKGNMRIGKANTDSSDCSAYIGSKVINLNGGTIQNNNNNLTITNDLNVMSETGFKTGWKKNITLTGNVTGSAKLKQVSDSGWLILQTHSDNDAFTGPFQTGWASTSSRGQTRLAAEQPLGANAGVLYNYGYLDMNGFSQKFKGVVDDGANNKKGRIYNTTANKSTVTFDITSQNLSYAGTIESNVELIINASGAGTQTFTNNTSNFTGNVTINGGTVKTTTAHSSYTKTDLGAFTTTGGRTITVNAGAELVLGTNDILGGCNSTYFDENSVRLILNGGKLSGTNNNPLYNATFQNGAEVYGNNNRDVYRSFWLMGPNTVSFAGDGETAESPVRFNGADGVIFVLDSAALDVDDITKSDA
ncbi:MAG: autotransporter-associated beta strand repeat-containing protein, partial [Thermoguttaceae bacterium]|nr:autotransporter-associated beta strand repeat-containing protein [Thermoguttaceae bacterium]